ncbi:MAG: pyrroline-5-carboxylate reductase [Clostridia bacterium]|nr:pyrroline-5-carboxylate reductase [Clostridia bacterium]
MKLGFIGTGNLATAILKGVVTSATVSSDEIAIFDINAEKVRSLSAELSVNAFESANEIVSKCENVVIAVKPKDMTALIESVSNDALRNDPLIISTAAGTSTEKLVACFGYDARIIRIMPNINAAVGESMTAICGSPAVTEDDKSFALSFCSCFGKAMQIEEKYFSAFTAVAGSAPAFAYMFADALASAGVKYGIPAAASQEIAAQMLLGSAKMLLESPLAVSDLIRNVCSPGGTTIEGVCSLKETGFENSVITAVDKTVEKDRKMSGK